MRLLLTCLCLMATPAAYPAELNNVQAAALEQAMVESSQKIRNHLLAVGRMSRTLVQPAVVLDKDGHLLTAFVPTIDGEPLSYLAYLDESKRVELETIWENEDAGLALLKIPALPEGITPANISEPGTLKISSWFIGASFPPTVLPEDIAQLKLGTLQTAPLPDNSQFLVNFNQHTTGTPLFDLAGRLCGYTTGDTAEITERRAQSIHQLTADHEELAPFIGEGTKAALPRLPYLIPDPSNENEIDEENAFTEEPPVPPSNPAREALEALAEKAVSDIPVVSIYNRAGIGSSGIQGVIVDSNGLILTKASEIGSSPSCHFDGQSYPAVLIATDEETDLALLSIEATDLPTVTWRKDPATPGQLVHVPLDLQSPPYEFPTASGILSHTMPAHIANAISIHSPEATTSLGIVPEQAETKIVIGGIIPGQAADKAKLRRGDEILAVDDKQTPHRNALVAALATKETGDEVAIEFKREDEAKTTMLTLDPVNFRQPMANSLMDPDPVTLFTPRSIRRSGFPATYVHDAPIEHYQNGSPLVNSQGEVIGINIATVTFGRTLALPADIVMDAIHRMKQNSIIF